jgi:hypothetical protein
MEARIEVIVAGKTIQLQVTPLGDPMDSYLQALFTDFFSEFHKPYPEFIKGCYQDLKTNIQFYFDSKIGNPPGQDYLFNNLTIIWKNYQGNGRLGEAQQFWEDILGIVRDWEMSRKQRIHKGSLFFFWSQTAILQGQFDKGFFLIHSAYEEDVLTHNNDFPATPAYKTVSLDYSDQGNFLFRLVEEWAMYLNGLIAKFPNLLSSVFTLEEFKTKFLYRPPSRDTLFSFTYILARFHDFDLLPTDLLRGNFTSLFEINILFDLVLVMDTVLYSTISNPGKEDWKFINLANRLLVRSGISTNSSLNQSHLGYINASKDSDFEGSLHQLLDQTIAYPDGISPSRLECDISIAYCLRNYSAHNIDSFPIISNRFTEIRQSIFNALFLAVQTS